MLKILVEKVRWLKEKNGINLHNFRFRKKIGKYDKGARATMLAVKDFTMISPDRIYSLIQAVRYVNRHNIEGAIVECGVYKGGGGVMAAMLTCKQDRVKSREFFLYDTFSGMSRPTNADSVLNGTVNSRALERFEMRKTGEDSSDWCFASLDEVKENLAATSCESSRIHYVQGKVEETIPEKLPAKISVLHLDTDWYESTSHEMSHLFPLLSPGGVLIIDDYNYWSGSRQAVDEYFSSKDIQIFLMTIGESAIGVKQ